MEGGGGVEGEGRSGEAVEHTSLGRTCTYMYIQSMYIHVSLHVHAGMAAFKVEWHKLCREGTAVHVA